MKIPVKLAIILFHLLFYCQISLIIAQAQEPTITETPDSILIEVPQRETVFPVSTSHFDPLTYTLGPDDVIEISVMRHPEFSGVFPVNKEGKLQYKFVGDIEVNGMAKTELEEKLKEILSVYINSPEVNVTITEYRSKHFYVLGDVTAPGKYYMRAETIAVREAVFEAGLPTTSAAMRKCRIISPSYKGKAKVRKVDLYAILYGGNLKKNVNLYPGDVLYVPSTVMAKIIRVISPVASTVGVAASGPESASTGRTAVETLQGRPGTR
ncbi:MAG: polysaccharide export protein [Candidatus Omnitrophica bacterium]|nr:polysaccharide export protein [Candidatus Omnitrophota bacterium]